MRKAMWYFKKVFFIKQNIKRRFINKTLRTEKANTEWRTHKAALMIADGKHARPFLSQ